MMSIRTNDSASSTVDIALAPCLDVASQPLNPVIGVRSFGADPQLVGRHSAAFVAGLRDAGVAAVGKHFPGHGATTVDSHLDLPVLDVPDALLRARDEQPFVTAAPDAVMTGHLVVPGRGPEPATLSAWASAEIRELGLDGPIITDALGMRAITDRHGIGEACVLALTAGADLLLLDAPHLRDAETDFRAAVSAIGGKEGYSGGDWLWRVRGGMDRFVGGPGLRRGRRHATELRPGDSLDFWRVLSVDPPTRLQLMAEMKLPGVATLTLEVEPIVAGEQKTKLVMTARFRQRGLFGIVYWYAVVPFHGIVFKRMLRGLVRKAEAAEWAELEKIGVTRVTFSDAENRRFIDTAYQDPVPPSRSKAHRP